MTIRGDYPSMRPLLFLTLVIAAAGFRTTTLPTQPKSHARTLRPQMIDNSFLVGGGVLLLGLGGGVGLIALTEQAGKTSPPCIHPHSHIAPLPRIFRVSH